MMDDLRRLLLVGDSSHPEFADALTLMRALCCVVELATPTDAIAWCEATDAPPALIVIAAARPGRFSEESIERLRRRLPVTPCVALLGAWCEGEMRSGAPWPGIERVYWYQWPLRFERELNRLCCSQCCSWDLPVTSSAEERLLWQSLRGRTRLGGVVAIVADQQVVAEWLIGSCQLLGWTAIWNSAWESGQTQGADVVIWDAGPIGPEASRRLEDIGNAFGDLPVIALADFPRVDDQRHLMAAGATAVLAKPLLVADLLRHLQKVRARCSATLLPTSDLSRENFRAAKSGQSRPTIVE